VAFLSPPRLPTPHNAHTGPQLYHRALPHHTPINLLDQRRKLDAGAVLRGVEGGSATSLYIHIPFCFHKCHYCDFYSLVDTQDRQEAFTRRLAAELAALAPRAGRLETVFVGGGTPTLLRPALWADLLACLHERFDFSGGPEFTVECNPETASAELFAVLKEGGVDRISVGAQSFDAGHLKTLERWHDPSNVPKALELARAAGIGRQSLDLIYAIPGQTLEGWERDLGTGLSAGTTHLSCYSLTYEPNTAMTARLKRGEFARADEDLEADMFSLTLERIRAAGMERYEVSNFARPGDECRHNLAYWRQRNWLAAGPSASAHMNGHRWKNVARLDDYLRGGEDGFAPITDYEAADARRNLAERIMTGLRISEGLDEASLLSDAGASAQRLGASARTFEARGLLSTSSGRWRLTDDGFLLADSIAADLMSCLDEP
jgi:oxygen-independent coproporphyrinogen III oxidase